MTVREFFQDAWVPNFKVKIADARNGGIFIYFMGRFEYGEPHGSWHLDNPPAYFMNLNVQRWFLYKETNLIYVAVEPPKRKQGRKHK